MSEINGYQLSEVNICDILSYTQKKKSHSDYSMGGWYLIRNKEDGLSYIGKSIEPIFRIRQHLILKNPKLHIDKKIKELGLDLFEFFIIDLYKKYEIDFFSRKLETSIEREFIIKFNTLFPNGYNKG